MAIIFIPALFSTAQFSMPDGSCPLGYTLDETGRSCLFTGCPEGYEGDAGSGCTLSPASLSGTDMKVINISVANIGGTISSGEQKVPILSMKITTTGTTNPVFVYQLASNLGGSSNPLLVTNSFIYHNTINDFNTATQVLDPTNNVGETYGEGEYVFKGLAVALQTGDNYFWLVYDTSASAIAGDKFDGSIDYIFTENSMFSSATIPAIVVPAPTGYTVVGGTVTPVDITGGGGTTGGTCDPTLIKSCDLGSIWSDASCSCEPDKRGNATFICDSEQKVYLIEYEDGTVENTKEACDPLENTCNLEVSRTCDAGYVWSDTSCSCNISIFDPGGILFCSESGVYATREKEGIIYSNTPCFFPDDLDGEIEAGTKGDLFDSTGGDGVKGPKAPSFGDPFLSVNNIDGTTLSKNSYFGNDANLLEDPNFRYIHDGTASQIFQISGKNTELREIGAIIFQTATSGISENVIKWKNPLLVTTSTAFISELAISNNAMIDGQTLIDNNLIVYGNVTAKNILWTKKDVGLLSIVHLIEDFNPTGNDLTEVMAEELNTMILFNGKEDNDSSGDHGGWGESAFIPSQSATGVIQIRDPLYISNNLLAPNIFGLNLKTQAMTAYAIEKAGKYYTKKIAGLAGPGGEILERRACFHTTSGLIYICNSADRPAPTSGFWKKLPAPQGLEGQSCLTWLQSFYPTLEQTKIRVRVTGAFGLTSYSPSQCLYSSGTSFVEKPANWSAPNYTPQSNIPPGKVTEVCLYDVCS